jgi:hypothetical protein
VVALQNKLTILLNKSKINTSHEVATNHGARASLSEIKAKSAPLNAGEIGWNRGRNNPVPVHYFLVH